jgi:hypothetical protein
MRTMSELGREERVVVERERERERERGRLG